MKSLENCWTPSNTHLLFALPLVLLTACSTTEPAKNPDASAASPETVLITYHVKPGKEKELQEVLSRVWKVYRQEHLVLAHPHVVVQDKENGDKTRMVEIFTWVSSNAPVRAHDSVAVKTFWDQMHSLCEGRDGHDGLEGGAVGLITP
jgi:hypothetical protein